RKIDCESPDGGAPNSATYCLTAVTRLGIIIAVTGTASSFRPEHPDGPSIKLVRIAQMARANVGTIVRLTFEFTRGRKRAKPAVGRRVQRMVGRHALNLLALGHALPYALHLPTLGVGQAIGSE